jgi:hypothetical protein
VDREGDDTVALEKGTPQLSSYWPSQNVFEMVMSLKSRLKVLCSGGKDVVSL